MKGTTRFTSRWTFFAIVAVLTCWFSAFPALANAQGSQGQDAVYNSSNGTMGSSSFIDASQFGASNTDICAVLNFIMSPGHGYPPAGAVIDARGLPGTTGTSMTCAASPWSGITSPPPSTILLPATTGTAPNPIVISSPWVLPSNTHLVGEGDGLFGTTIQVASGSSLATMLQFGSSSFCGSSACTGISVEDLTLDGQAQSIDGILNQYAGTNSYVDHVRIYQILGTGLLVSGASATNSGSYSSIKTKATPVKGPVSPR